MTQEYGKGNGPEERRSSEFSSTPPPASEQAREEAQAVWEEASRRGKGFLEDRKGAIAGQVEALSGALNRAARDLDRSDAEWMGHYMTQAAEGLNRVSRNFRDREVDDILDRTREFIRTQPAAVLGGAVAAGLLLSRFLRSSGSREHSESSFHSGEGEQYERRHSDVVATSDAPEVFSETIKTEPEEEHHGTE